MGRHTRTIWRASGHEGRHTRLRSLILLPVRQAPVNKDNAGANGDTAVSSYSDTGGHFDANTNRRVYTNCADGDTDAAGNATVNGFADTRSHFDANANSCAFANRDTHSHGNTALNGPTDTGAIIDVDVNTNGHACTDGDANRDPPAHGGTNGNTGKGSGRAGTEPRFI